MSITRYHFNSFNLGCHFAQGNEFQSMQPTIVEMVKASDYDALSRDVAATRAELVTMTAMWGERVRDYDESRAELDEALKYAHHTPECDCMQDELPCTCGLNALLRKVGK